MDEKLEEVLGQYDFKVNRVSRTRGALLLDTDRGLKLCKNTTTSPAGLEMENQVKEELKKTSYCRVDSYVPNRENSLITVDSLGDRYVVKDWFEGTECNVREMKDLKEAAANLGLLHARMRIRKSADLQTLRAAELEADDRPESIGDIFLKHNRELKRVYWYVKKKKQRNEFEALFLNLFPEVYGRAEEAAALFAGNNCALLERKALQDGCICHGNYTYHNVLILKDGVATTNFDKCGPGLQLTDLYYFLRKVMEKHDWNMKVGDMILEEYNRSYPLSEEELHLLGILLWYPEKFWKVMNFYYNKKKSWVPYRNYEKLLKVQKQTQDKLSFSGKLLYNISNKPARRGGLLVFDGQIQKEDGEG
ncbi:CotS family spore coat protein [Anaerolentibacter hominis]|uniref:CotS family spore coat protein n=1 Tax=Anaerolentibacter hominis TaxID=3079009 RepID=UPI0031B89CEE